MTDPRYPSVPLPPLPATSPSPTPTPWPLVGYQPSPRRRRVPGWIVAVAAATSVAAVASFLTVLLWPAGGEEGGPDEPSAPLSFLRFGSVARVDFDHPSHTTLTAVEGGRGYTAWEQGGDLHVIAFDVPSGQERWQQEVAGPSQWSRLIAAPGALLVLQRADADDQPRRMYVLDSETGAQRWHRDVRADDVLVFLDGALGWLDRQGRALRGLDLVTGGERWRHPFPSADEDSYAVSVLNQADLARPSDPSGVPAPGFGDHRIVMVNPDRTVWVIDGNTGRILSQAGNLAEPDDQVLGYGNRLYVAANDVDYQLLSYDLAQLSGVPQVHYAPSDTDRYPTKLQPCGPTRVCLLETAQFDPARTDLVAVNAVDGGQIWRVPANETEGMFGVGEWVVTVASVEFQPTVSVFDQSGARVLESPGLAVRLNDANLLVVTTAGGYETYVEAIGLPVGGAQVNLGRLPEGPVQEECSWNDRYLVCPDRDGAEIFQFAQPG